MGIRWQGWFAISGSVLGICWISAMAVPANLQVSMTPPVQVGIEVSSPEDTLENALKLFDSSEYTSPGQELITVKSDWGDAVIAPGTEGETEFGVTNQSEVPIRGYLTLWEENQYEIPMVYRVLVNRGGKLEYEVGSETQWVRLSDEEGKNRTSEFCLAPGGSSDYRLEWKWPYEGEQGDEQDTRIAARAAGDLKAYLISLKVCAEEDEIITVN